MRQEILRVHVVQLEAVGLRRIEVGNEAWNYDYLIDLYTRAFGEENVIVLPYELLRDDVQAFTRTIEQRLGLAHAAVAPERLNPSLSAEELWWYPRLTRAVRRMPLGARVRAWYARAAMANRFRGLIRVLDRVRAGTPLTAESIPAEVVNDFRGKAERLRHNPLYAPYASEYLL